ncbi:hypothetical protein CLOM_g14311 [Closterium sp. NIES-68]|nr:hypothetical protein CLOM_g14311 [Closterium sp. NIES-68]GJP61705.1 hypothetical protein CLOP_g18849 [Closterium sp. NIES-67]
MMVPRGAPLPHRTTAAIPAVAILCDPCDVRASHACRSTEPRARNPLSCDRVFRSAPTATVAAAAAAAGGGGGLPKSRAAHNLRATPLLHPTRFLRTRSARKLPSYSPSSHRIAVSAASAASQAPGGSEPSRSTIGEIREEEYGGKPRGRFLQDDVGPNEVVLEAQARVCTGPTQTRALSEDEMRRVLEQILLSAKGELPPSERVSRAQMGAFFAGMTVRANCFPPPTQWTEGERRALDDMWPSLRYHLPRDVLFLADPQGSIFNDALPVGPTFLGFGSEEEAQVVGDLRDILCGVHLGFQETMSLLQSLLPMRGGNGEEEGVGGVSDALVAAYLIAIRMNRETDRELKAFCLAFDQELGPAPVANVPSLTHYGDPYDGSTRYFRPTLFVAAVRASCGEACLLHGVDSFPPKLGATEEAMLRLLGGNTSLSPAQAAAILEDPQVRMAYLSLKDCSPSCYSLVDMRRHIKKRPTFATTEKVQRYIHASGREAMVAGFYHEGYEEPLLMLMRRQPVEAGLVVKGEEGSLALMTRRPAPDAPKKGRPVNYCAGFRPGNGGSGEEGRGGGRGGGGGEGGESGGEEDGFYRETFSMEADAMAVAIQETLTPRIDRSPQKNLDLGLEALRGTKGPAYDRVVFNAAVQDHLLGYGARAIGLAAAVERAREAVDSGRAMRHLMGYVERSKQMQ